MDLNRYREATEAVVFQRYEEAINVSFFRVRLFQLFFIKFFSQILNETKELAQSTMMSILIQRGECYFRQKSYKSMLYCLLFCFIVLFFLRSADGFSKIGGNAISNKGTRVDLLYVSVSYSCNL